MKKLKGLRVKCRIGIIHDERRLVITTQPVTLVREAELLYGLYPAS